MSLQAFFLLLFLSHSLAYNLDTRNVYFVKDPASPRKSYFGFSTALYPPGKKILVGAPRANAISSNLKNVVEPGVVYFCSIRFENKSVICSEEVIDDNAVPSRENAWLGAVIQVENSTTNKIVITAPKWKKPLYFKNYGKLTALEGASYSIIIQDDGSYKEHQYFPMAKSSNRYHFMFGFSAHLISESGDVIVGAPGDENCMLITKDELIIFNKTDYYLEYFGYSVTSGYFHNRRERLYAAGVPKASNIFGQVVIFQIQLGKDNSLVFKKILSGEQMGAYFGSSLASCDINNDGRDDLIVGAPLWSDEGDEGCVYVYSSKNQSDFDSRRVCGTQVNGRFGTTITCLGDLDYDGWFDVAVGAPYEDSGRGAVYVLNGAADGRLVLSQRLAAAETSESLRGFGMSISEPRDLDGDRYADVAVGAYLSGHAVLLMSRPVVTLNMALSRLHSFALKTDTSEFGVEACVWYDGAFGPVFIRVSLTLRIDKFHKRAMVNQTGSVNNNTYTLVTPLNKKELKCIPVNLLLIENIQNILDPIEITGNVSIEEEPSCIKCPVLNPSRSIAEDNLNLKFFLDCGSDNLCISDLRVNVTSGMSQNNYVIGSSSNVNLTVVVENRGELAYRAQVHIYIPQPVALARMPPECNQQSEVNQTILVICSIGNPLRLNNSLTLELDLNAVEYTPNSTEIRVIAATISQLEDSSYNNASLKINYSIDADIAMLGRSNGTLLWYSKKDVSDPHLKKIKFHHIYEILKFGFTPIKEVAIAVNVPTHWKNNTITKINQIESFIDGRRCDCEHIKNENFTTDTFQNFFYEANDSTVIPPDNRTFYVNCSNTDVTCQTLHCKLGPFRKAQSVAKLSILITFQLSSATVEATRGKDIIFFVTNGHVEIIQPNFKLPSSRLHFKQIATTIFNRNESHKVEIWIIVVSVLFGIILLALLSLLLYKLGFFNRDRKENLQNMKANEKMINEHLMTVHESDQEQE